jgi:hypothetical protein
MKPVNKHLIAKYHKFNRLRIQGKLSSADTKEFMDICNILLDQLLKDNADLLKRLKVSDVNSYNLQQTIGK